MSTRMDEHFLPGVSFTLNGETLPARELAWAMVASCGCTAGVHMMTEDVMNETMAWKVMSGNAAKQKQDKDRGFTIGMVKSRDVNFGDCTHSPKWGYTPPPTPPGYSWATTDKARTLHLVPLTELDREEKESHREWAEDDGTAKTGRLSSVCERADYYLFQWSRKWYLIDGKVECTHCVKIAEKQVLL